MTRKAPPPNSCRNPKTPSPGTSTSTARPANISSTPTITMPPRTNALMDASPRWLLGALGRGCVRDHDDGRAVRDDLGHRPRDLAAVKAHRDHGVGAHERGVLDEPVQGLPAG